MQGRIIAILFVLYFVYLCIGAAVFSAIEFSHEEESCQQTIDQLKRYNLSDVRSSVQFNNGSISELVEVTFLGYSKKTIFSKYFKTIIIIALTFFELRKISRDI